MNRAFFSLVAGGGLLSACGNDIAGDETFSIPDPALHVANHEIIVDRSTFGRASLGDGYDDVAEVFRGNCLSGAVELIGGEESSLSFERTMEAEEVATDLGFEARARGRYGLATFKGSASFASKTRESKASTTATYSATYRLVNRRLVNPHLKPGYAAITDDASAFRAACGHEFVEQVAVGGKLYVGLRVDFTSEDDKREFEARFDIKNGLGKASAELKEGQEHFKKRALVTVQVHQLGGDATMLSAALSGLGGTEERETNALTAVIKCDLDSPANMEHCDNAMVTALTYATSTSNPRAFPQQVRENPVDLAYSTKPWATIPVALPPDIVSEAVDQARKELRSMFDQDVTAFDRIRALRGMTRRMAQGQQSRLAGLSNRALANLQIDSDAALKCYEKLDECIAAVAEVARTRDVIEERDFDFQWGPLAPGEFVHRNTIFTASSDGTYCSWSNPAHYETNGGTYGNLTYLPDYDAYHTAMTYTGACHLFLPDGFYHRAEGWLLHANGDHACYFITPQHYMLGANHPWGEWVDLRFIPGFDNIVLRDGPCRVILPEGNFLYKNHVYYSDGQAGFCYYETGERFTAVSKQPWGQWLEVEDGVPFRDFMTHRGGC